MILFSAPVAAIDRRRIGLALAIAKRDAQDTDRDDVIVDALSDMAVENRRARLATDNRETARQLARRRR